MGGAPVPRVIDDARASASLRFDAGNLVQRERGRVYSVAGLLGVNEGALGAGWKRE